MQVNYERQFSLSALHKARATYRSNGAYETGRVIQTQRAVTSTAAHTGAVLDNTVSSTGGAGYFQNTTVAGGAAITPLMQHSSDNITYATLFTFTSGVDRLGQRLVTTGVIERYTRPLITPNAGGVGTSYQYFMGLYRGPLSS